MEEEYYYEEFRAIPGFPGYQVSDLGRIWSNKTSKYSKINVNTNGYPYLELDGKTKTIHPLIAKAFLKNPESKRCVDHINCIRTDNRLVNLRWSTHSQNNQNRKLSSRNTSGINGVGFNKSRNRWRAQIKIDGISVHLGYFKTIEEAQQVRVAKANEVLGEYTHSCEKL